MKRWFYQRSFKFLCMGDNGTHGSREPRSQAWKSGYKEGIDEVSISARPQWELAAMAKRDQYNKLLQFPQPPLDIPWGENARAVTPLLH